MLLNEASELQHMFKSAYARYSLYPSCCTSNMAANTNAKWKNAGHGENLTVLA